MQKRPNQGRWDHLLREIPSPTKKQQTPQESFEPEVLQASVVEPVETEPEEEIFSVSNLNKAIKKTLEGGFTHIWVRGEISNFKAHTSGHHYFSLKDEKAQISAVMFRGFNAKLKFRPESGMEVLVRGKITVYEPRGNYQIFCESMEPVGAGALQKAFEQLKAKLQQEGLFDANQKQALPDVPQKVGVVTSPTGAAIQDILNVLSRRSKRVQVTVIPARVQGEGSADEIVKGIELANSINAFDVLIVGRGGGSIEDLWCFNEERVARAIFKSKIPVISAVGHEIDFTISDFVADLRAPTPSAAAELVSKSEQELHDKLKFYSRSLRLMIFQKIQTWRQKLQHQQKSLIDPRKSLRDSALRLDEWNQRLFNVIIQQIKNRRLEVKAYQKGLKSPAIILDNSRLKAQNLEQKLKVLMNHKLDKSQSLLTRGIRLLDSLSPLRTVDRGYGIVRQNGHLIPDINSLKTGPIEIEMRDGFIEGEVKNTRLKEEV